MWIRSLSLQNFRCFERLALPLDPHVTVLVGANGAGKTAVLDALAVAIGGWLSGTGQAANEDRPLQASDARLVRQDTGALPTVNPVFPVSVAATAEIPGWGGQHDMFEGTNMAWSRELARPGGRTSRAGTVELREAAAAAEQRASTDPNALLPLFAHLGTGRRWLVKRTLAARPQTRSRFSGYAACLEQASDQKRFEAWMRQQELAHLQAVATAQEAGRPVEGSHAGAREAVLDAVVTSLEGCRRFSYSVAHRELRVEFADGRLLPFACLSDGQRTLILLAADLAWRAVQLNPSLGREAPRRTAGVVLIDEIELHLHPRWQHTVLDRLRAAFPSLQFVVTTHSPQVVASARPEWVRVLSPDGSWARVTHTSGRDSNALLRDVFGAPERPPGARERLDRIADLLSSGELGAAQRELDELEQALGTTDHELMGLRWELRDLQVHGVDPR